MKSRQVIAILIVALIALAGVYGFLGRDYLGQQRQHDGLSAQLTEARLALASTPQPPPGLEQAMSTAKADLAAVRSAFPEDLKLRKLVK